MAYVICITNQKGGVGKTTTADAIADVFMRSGKRVLMIDTDPQCNTTDTYRAITQDVATLYDVLIHGDPITESIQHTEAGDILPCDPLLKNADVDMFILQSKGKIKNKNLVLKQAIAPIMNDYDYIIIDTRPDMGVLLINALACTHGIIIPTTSDRYALQGISQLGAIINEVRETLNPDLTVMGLLRMLHESRLTINIAAQPALKRAADGLHTSVFKTCIRKCVATRKAQSSKLLLSEYNAKLRVYIDYEKLTKEIENRIGVI